MYTREQVIELLEQVFPFKKETYEISRVHKMFSQEMSGDTKYAFKNKRALLLADVNYNIRCWAESAPTTFFCSLDFFRRPTGVSPFYYQHILLPNERVVAIGASEMYSGNLYNQLFNHLTFSRGGDGAAWVSLSISGWLITFKNDLADYGVGPWIEWPDLFSA